MLQENDDMEELLRRAAENYPLKTDNADWEKVRQALAVEGMSSPEKKSNYRSLWLLLLLLPLGWAGYQYFSSPSPVNKTAVKNNNVREKVPGYLAPAVDKQADEKNNTPAVEETEVQHEGQTTTPNTGSLPTESPVITRVNNKKVKVSGKTTVTIEPAGDATTTINNVSVNEKSELSKNNEIVQTGESKNESEKANDIVSPKEQESIALVNASTEDKKLNNQAKRKTKKTKSNFLYAGVLIAPDISTVKFQSVKSIGVNKGIIAGYQLNKNLAVETGIMWDKKFYYSDGEYFNTGKIYLPPNAKIINVTGNCKMIEIPLTIKYNIKSSGKGTWFSAAGLSSYLMKEENYTYSVVILTGAPYPYQKKYQQASKYLLSMVNLSAGYTHTLGKTGTLRIEPYIKFPLKGVGIGSLPITSAGVNLGITKRLF